MDWKATQKHQTKLKRFTKLYANMVLNGDIDARKAINVYDRTEQKPEWKLKRLLRSQTVQDMITNEVIELYEKNRITPEYVIKQEKALLKATKADDDHTNRFKILQTWGRRMELDPKTTVNKQTEEYHFSRHLPSGEKQQLKAKQMKEIEEGGTANLNPEDNTTDE